MSWIKKIIRALLYAVYLLMVSVVLLELIFRFLPVNDSFDVQVVNQENPIVKFEENVVLETSVGWNFYQTARKSTNSNGFVSSVDYELNGEPDIAVIGDSMVEAMQVDNNEAIAEYLMTLDADLSVYAFAVSGVPLSQYLKFAEHAEKTYSPAEYLIVVVGNDFDESICDLRPKQGVHCFDNTWRLKLIDFPGYSFLRKAARSSAFMRYTVFNLGINWRQVVSRIGLRDSGAADRKKYAGNTERMKEDGVKEKSYRVVDEFLSSVKVVTNNKKITLLVDADRRDIYSGNVTQSYFRDMRDYLISEASTAGFNVIDMEPVFKKHYEEFGLSFEFPTNAHWNELGHELAAKEFLGRR